MHPPLSVHGSHTPILVPVFLQTIPHMPSLSSTYGLATPLHGAPSADELVGFFVPLNDDKTRGLTLVQ